MAKNIKGDLSVARRSSAGLAMNLPVWSTGKNYIPNDMFLHNGDVYLVTTAHTSTTSPQADIANLSKTDTLTYETKAIAANAVAAEVGKHITVSATGAVAGDDVTIDGTGLEIGDYGVVYNASGVELDIVVSNITVAGTPLTVLAAYKQLSFVVNADGEIELTGTGYSLANAPIQLSYATVNHLSTSNSSVWQNVSGFTSTQNTSLLQPSAARAVLNTATLVGSRGINVNAQNLIVTLTGEYSVSLGIEFDTSNGTQPYFAQLVKNGTTVLASCSAYDGVNTNQTIGASLRWFGALNANDTLDIRCAKLSTGTVGIVALTLLVEQAASAVAVDPAITVGSPATITTTGGIGTLSGGSASVSVYESVPTVLAIDLAANTALSSVTPSAGTASIIDAAVGTVLVVAPAGSGSVNLAVTTGATLSQSLAHALVSHRSTSNSSIMQTVTGYANTQNTTILQPATARIVLNTANLLDSSSATIGTNNITVGATGSYRVDLSIEFDTSTGNHANFAQIVKNGTDVLASCSAFNSDSANNTNDTLGTSTMWIGDLAAGDTIDVRVSKNTVGTVGIVSFAIILDQRPSSVPTLLDPALVPVITDDTLATGTDLNVASSLAVKTYVDTKLGDLISTTAEKKFLLQDGLQAANEVDAGGPCKFRYGSNAINGQLNMFNKTGAAINFNSFGYTNGSGSLNQDTTSNGNANAGSWTTLGTASLVQSMAKYAHVTLATGDSYRIYMQGPQNTTASVGKVLLRVEYFPA